MTAAEKVRMAHELAALGVDVVEAGFTASSHDDAQAILRIAREVRGTRIATLARATESDIRVAAESLEGAEAPRIHVFIATSDIHLEHKLRVGRGECLERAAAAVALARTYVDDVEFSAEDATRSDVDFLCQVVQAAVEAGATTVNIPDTVGYAIPPEMAGLIRTLLDRVPGLRDRIVSVHCHDDLGLAVANTLAAVEAGARQVECTINGIGERAGNAALEEIVMALRVRHDSLGATTRIRTERLYRTSRLLSHLTGIQPQPNKAIVGRNAFAHEAGIHQHGMLRERSTYEIMTPELVGAPGSALVLGKHSGRHGLEARYRKMGYALTPEELDRVTRDFKALADRKKEILDEDLLALLHHGTMEDAPEVYRLAELDVRCGGEVSTARVVLESDGESDRQAVGTGDGPVDAAFAALATLTDANIVLQSLTIRSSTPGEDALGEVSIQARADGHTFTGRGASTDVVRASVHAYVHLLNKVEQARVLEARHLELTANAWAV